MSLRVLLEDQIEKLFSDNPELETVNKNRFEVAVAAFANLNHLYGIEFDDLVDGILGQGGDEGIDLCYIFCNGVLVKDENYPINRDSHIRVKLFQVKKENGFSTDGYRKLKEGVEEIFNLELELEQLQRIGANQEFIDQADLIRKLYRESKRQRAKFTCEIYYVTAAPEIKIEEKIRHYESELRNHPLGIDFEFSYMGAQRVLDLTERTEETIEIRFNTQPLELKEKNVAISGFAGFVRGNDVINALTDEEGEFRSQFTEGNVRFFLGEDKKINSSIIESAMDESKAQNFWAMNNGLTILGDSIEAIGNNEYSIVNPQIVNGCQTVHCLYYAFSEQERLSDSLLTFVKLVNTSDLEIQTDIISATNSQNPVKAASLKANDNIQRNIERHLKKSNIYYERRENYYKRQGFTGNKVIGLLKMAQIVHTVVNKEAVVAVNDTSTLFETATKYNSIFHDSADFDIYMFSAVLYQKIWSLKNSDIRNNNYEDEIQSLISKAGFIFLHVMSTLMISEAQFVENNETKSSPIYKNILISSPARKNEFTKRKKWLLEKLDDEEYLSNIYEKAKELFFLAAAEYSRNQQREKLSLFKQRSFDKDFLIPEIQKIFEIQDEDE